MKRSIFMTLVIGAGLIFFGCSDKNPTAPEMSQSGQVPASLGKVVKYFSGTSTNIGFLDPGKTNALPNGRVQIRGLVVQTEDILTDLRVTGIVTWVVHLNIYPEGNDTRWGSGELIIPDVGRWDMTYKGWLTPGEGLTYEVDGHGKGELKGLKAHWTYFLPNPPGVFEVQGFIIERN
ncbi:MAG: hypothetical protein OEM41_07235 [Ignavibacteria bacterium]|nr:hypothetical protein [Ignavibacteria bacterium]